MALFTSRREFYTSLISGLLAVSAVIALVITLTTNSATNAMRVETLKPISEITTRVHDVEAETEGLRKEVGEVKTQVGELDVKFTKAIEGVQLQVKDSEKSVITQIDRMTNVLMSKPVSK